MTYYGILTKSKETLESLEETVEQSLDRLKPEIDKFWDSLREKIWGDVEDYLAGDCAFNLRGAIARECETIIEAFLCGDEKILKQTNIISEYNFARLSEVRKAIWDQCADELQKIRLKELEEENERLKEDVKFYREIR